MKLEADSLADLGILHNSARSLNPLVCHSNASRESLGKVSLSSSSRLPASSDTMLDSPVMFPPVREG